MKKKMVTDNLLKTKILTAERKIYVKNFFIYYLIFIVLKQILKDNQIIY